MAHALTDSQKILRAACATAEDDRTPAMHAAIAASMARYARIEATAAHAYVAFVLGFDSQGRECSAPLSHWHRSRARNAARRADLVAAKAERFAAEQAEWAAA